MNRYARRRQAIVRRRIGHAAKAQARALLSYRNSASTGIEWTGRTLNFWVGCDIYSAGCAHCYAMHDAGRLSANPKMPHYQGVVTKAANGAWVWTGKIGLAPESTMLEPLKRRKPTVYFVCSMSDFFHPDVPDAARREAIDTMRRCRQHVFQILTKRPELAAAQLRRIGVDKLPSNIWLGVTVENGMTAWRIDELRKLRARVKFVSFEPLIADVGLVNLTGIDWAIIGGESGKRARRCEEAWVRSLVTQCQAQGVAVFFKQWGTPQSNPLAAQCPPAVKLTAFIADADPNGKGGALLDGKLIREMPAPVPSYVPPAPPGPSPQPEPPLPERAAPEPLPSSAEMAPVEVPPVATGSDKHGLEDAPTANGDDVDPRAERIIAAYARFKAAGDGLQTAGESILEAQAEFGRVLHAVEAEVGDGNLSMLLQASCPEIDIGTAERAKSRGTAKVQADTKPTQQEAQAAMTLFEVESEPTMPGLAEEARSAVREVSEEPLIEWPGANAG